MASYEDWMELQENIFQLPETTSDEISAGEKASDYLEEYDPNLLLDFDDDI